MKNVKPLGQDDLGEKGNERDVYYSEECGFFTPVTQGPTT